MSKTKYPTITEAQHAVMGEIKMLAKDKEGYEYIYTSAAFATIMLRPLMIKHGISKFKVHTEHRGRWQNGVGVDYTLTFRYQLTGATELVEGVTYQDVLVEASGKVGKAGDKSTFASQTTGSKYADLDFFNLPMVDDVEEYEETAEILEEMYGDDPEPKSKKKTSKSKPEKEPEEEEDDEVPSSSKDLTYDEGVLDIIPQVFEAGGEDALTEFTKGDRRKDVKALVKELLEEEAEEEEDEEEEEEAPKPKKKTSKKSSKKKSKPEPEEEDEDEDEEEVSLDDIDYDDPKMVKALLDQIDLEDEDQISEIITGGFSDAEALKAFYTVCIEAAGEIGADFQVQFNESHFDELQETFEELTD